MAHILNLKPTTIKKFKQIHNKLYCNAKLQGKRFWSTDDTLNEIMEVNV